METKICPIKSGMEKQTVYCTPDCGYYCEAGKDTKCGIAIAMDFNLTNLLAKTEQVRMAVNALLEAVGK